MTALANPTTQILRQYPVDQPQIANRPLTERLAARVSSSLDEIAAFATVDLALQALASGVFGGKRVTIARPAGDAIAQIASRAAQATREVGARPFDQLVAAARESDVLVLSSPVVSASGLTTLLSPRELLLLRSRAPRPVIVLDLLEEDRARTPLTQPALLLPGTLILRGFGELWRSVGAEGVADTAFIAGPRDLIGALEVSPFPIESVARACNALDLPNIDRAVQARAAVAHTPA